MQKAILLIAIITTAVHTLTAQVATITTVPITKSKTLQALASKPETIRLDDIVESLCPQTLARGDREFDGHGPRVKCSAELILKNNGTEIWAKINFEAVETVQDFSTTTGVFNVKVYTTPYGKKITKIVSNKFSRTQFISPPAGFQLLVPGADMKAPLKIFFDGQVITNAVLAAHGIPGDAVPAAVAALVSSYIKENTVIVVPPVEGTLVKFFHIVGDTGGEDISNDDNCKEDTRIEKIEFYPVQVIMQNVN